MNYQVYDRVTGRIIGTYTSKQRARNKRDKMDNEYGSYRYGVRLVEVGATA